MIPNVFPLIWRRHMGTYLCTNQAQVSVTCIVNRWCDCRRAWAAQFMGVCVFPCFCRICEYHACLCEYVQPTRAVLCDCAFAGPHISAREVCAEQSRAASQTPVFCAPSLSSGPVDCFSRCTRKHTQLYVVVDVFVWPRAWYVSLIYFRSSCLHAVYD